MAVGRFPRLDPEARRGRRSASFLRGFTAGSPLVLAVAALLLVPALVGLHLFFTSGAWTSIAMERWMRKASDDWTYVSWTVGANKRHPSDLPTVYLLGGSSARESILSGPSLARRVAALGGPRIEAFDLGSMNQNFAQSLAIADNVPDTPALLVVGVNYGRFTPSPGDNQKQAVGRELLLDSPYLRAYVRGIAPQYRDDYSILPGILGYFTSYLEQHGSELLHLSLPSRRYGQHRYNLKSIHTVKQKEGMVRRWSKRRAPVFRRNLEYNLRMLRKLLERADERGLDVLLLELPFNATIIGDEFDWVKQAYQPRVRALAEESGVPYVDYSLELPLENIDFHDLSHLNESGRGVWERRLAEELVRYYEDHPEAAGAP
jgi:hypothetical protein